MWQDIAVYVIVASAAIYLVRHFIASSRSDEGCGGCGGCKNTSPQKEELVQIDLSGNWKR
ncbi:MAG TPA: FeoB-associated Cys-rich membrane protein [Abditibacterium sp.]|jgi:hypothetical protein